MKLKMLSVGMVLTCSLGLQGRAMERWAALAQIESGNNDHALGAAGEISRYQIKPRVWNHYASASANWRRAEQSLPIAQAAMRDRCAGFERNFRRPPTDFEFYVLWNAPAQIRRPSAAVRKRAQRFCNLLKSGAASNSSPAEFSSSTAGAESLAPTPAANTNSSEVRLSLK